MSGMGKVFDLLNRINKLTIPKDSKQTPDSGMNAKVKVGENIIIKLNGGING